MQKIAGDKLRNVLAKFTKNRFTGLLTGAGITSLIQSSSVMTVEIRNNHLQRVNNRICVPIAGVNFVDAIMNIEKIGDHLANIAHAILGSLSWNHNDKI